MLYAQYSAFGLGVRAIKKKKEARQTSNESIDKSCNHLIERTREEATLCRGKGAGKGKAVQRKAKILVGLQHLAYLLHR